MSEFDKLLDKNEKIVWEGKPHFGNYFLLSGFFTALALIFLVLGIIFSGIFYFFIISFVLFIFAISRILSYRLLAYAITNRRAIIQSGIIGADYKSIDFDKIQEINVEVDLLGKIFNTGNIELKTAGINVVNTRYGQNVVKSGNVIAYVENPYEISKKIKKSA